MGFLSGWIDGDLGDLDKLNTYCLRCETLMKPGSDPPEDDAIVMYELCKICCETVDMYADEEKFTKYLKDQMK